MLGKASKSENLLKNRSAVGCCGFFARIGDIADGKRQNVFSIFGDFVLLSDPREPDLESAVEHFFNF